MSAKGRVFGFFLALLAYFLIDFAWRHENLIVGIAGIVIGLMGLGKMKGY